jgi:uncharacterized protein
MPVRSLNSPVLKWPNRETVVCALKEWVVENASSHPELLRVGYFGSYAKGSWGVGSDVDILLILEHSEKTFIERGSSWDLRGLPVPAELIIYTQEEWEGMKERDEPFYRQLSREVVWIYQREFGKGGKLG